MASASSFVGFRFTFFSFFRLYDRSAPLFSVWMVATKEAGSGAQVPPVFTPGSRDIDAPDWGLERRLVSSLN